MRGPVHGELIRRDSPGAPRRLGPAPGIVLGMMKHFAIGDGVVPVLLEVRVERCDARGVLLRPGQLVDESIAGRTNAGD